MEYHSTNITLHENETEYDKTEVGKPL